MPTADYSSYHQPSGTAADGTKLDNFIDAVQTTVNGLDKNNLAANAGLLASQLADPTTGKVLGSSGSACAAVFPPGYEYSYVPFTANVPISATTEATANTIVTAAAVAFDGATTVMIDFFAPVVQPAASAGGEITLVLYDGASSIGFLADVLDPAAAQGAWPVRATQRLTPAAATKTYSVRAFRAVGNGTVVAGVGGAAAFIPGYVRITKV